MFKVLDDCSNLKFRYFLTNFKKFPTYAVSVGTLEKMMIRFHVVLIQKDSF